MKKMNEKEEKPRFEIKDYAPSLGSVKEIHTRFEVSNNPYQNFDKPLRPSSEPYLDEVGKIGTQIIREIFDIKGVVRVSITPYCLDIEKAPLFSWDEIEKDLIYILNRAPDDLEELETRKALEELFG